MKDRQTSPLESTECELKIALGGSADFEIWKKDLGIPSQILNQLNFYFRALSPYGDSDDARHILLRIRSICDQSCIKYNTYCDLCEQLNDKSLSRENISSSIPCLATQSFVFTYKQRLEMSEGYFKSLELECPLNVEQIVSIFRGDLNSLKSTAPGMQLSKLNISRCRFLGTLQNTRLRYPSSTGEIWELDLSHYGNCYDCELEIETNHPQRTLTEVKRRAKCLGKAIAMQTRTKLERFLEATTAKKI